MENQEIKMRRINIRKVRTEMIVGTVPTTEIMIEIGMKRKQRKKMTEDTGIEMIESTNIEMRAHLDQDRLIDPTKINIEEGIDHQGINTEKDHEIEEIRTSIAGGMTTAKDMQSGGSYTQDLRPQNVTGGHITRREEGKARQIENVKDGGLHHPKAVEL